MDSFAKIFNNLMSLIKIILQLDLHLKLLAYLYFMIIFFSKGLSHFLPSKALDEKSFNKKLHQLPKYHFYRNINFFLMIKVPYIMENQHYILMALMRL
jgi:hypothetical protein